MKFFIKSVIFIYFLLYSTLNFAQLEDWQMVGVIIDTDLIDIDDEKINASSSFEEKMFATNMMPIFQYIDISSIKIKSGKIRSAKIILTMGVAAATEVKFFINALQQGDVDVVFAFLDSQQKLARQLVPASSNLGARRAFFERGISKGMAYSIGEVEIDCNTKNKRGRIIKLKDIDTMENLPDIVDVWENLGINNHDDYYNNKVGMGVGKANKLNANSFLWQEVCKAPLKK